MALQDVFEHRSGRVIAVFRAVLAFVFLIALLFEPVAATNRISGGRELLAGYFVFSLALIALAWKSWWYDHILALPVLALDIGVFLIAVFLTEGSNADFTSPFLAVFALTVLSATLRWDWRAAAATGLLVTLMFLAVGATFTLSGVPVDLYRFSRRAIYMLALLLVLVWFGVQRRAPHVASLDAPVEPDGAGLPNQALALAMELAGAKSGMLAWNPIEEPWTDISAMAADGSTVSARLGPEQSRAWEEGAGETQLFDLSRNRKLVLGPHGRARAMALRSPVPLAAEHGILEGLAAPLGGVSGNGLLILGGIEGPGPDFLLLGQAIGREIGTAFDRHMLAQFERESIVARTRSAIARDLHDSVAQSLAGACFRLEALRRTVHQPDEADGGQAERELVSVRDALRREQGHIRTLIESLRGPAQPPQFRDLRADLDLTLADAGAHWNVAVAIDAPGRIEVPGWISHELQQLVREAVANAARHGGAGRVTAWLTLAGSGIQLKIEDDGSGFGAGSGPGRPWSISERVSSIGGKFDVRSGASGTCLLISLPVLK